MGLILKNFQVLKANLVVQVPLFEVPSPSWTRVEAPSGFGKTTLLRGILGLEKTTGEVFLHGKNLSTTPTHLREIGFVFQDQSLFSQKSVFDNVAFGLKLRGHSTIEIQEKVLSALTAVGLQDKIHAAVTDCSGGERQRVAILRAMIWEPQLLLLDEPFVGLDQPNRMQTLTYLRKIVGLMPVPVIWISHTQDDLNEGVDHRLVGQHSLGTAEGEKTNVRQFKQHHK
jgi:ABC-type sulfate/molybdate transport systems ATPase subunit